MQLTDKDELAVFVYDALKFLMYDIHNFELPTEDEEFRELLFDMVKDLRGCVKRIGSKEMKDYLILREKERIESAMTTEYTNELRNNIAETDYYNY